MTNPNDPAFELWKPVPGYENEYVVSDLGRVRGWYMGGNRRRVPKLKVPQKNRNGYLYILLSHKKQVKAWTIHRLVLTTFTNPHSSKIDACHLNGKRSDNRLSNLAWATRKENEAHKILHGTKAIGEKNGQSKLKQKHIDEIWMALYKGLSQKFVAEQYGVCQQTVSAIASGKTWRDICSIQK